MVLRPIAPSDSIAELTRLLHAAYGRLAAMGLNYTAVDQSEDATRRQIASATCLVAVDRGVLVGTIQFQPAGQSGGCPHYERPDVATFHKFGVRPDRQGLGNGGSLIEAVERLAIESGAAELALDTAEGSSHLVAYYQRRGFRHVEYAQWPGKTYRSVIMSKTLRGQ